MNAKTTALIAALGLVVGCFEGDDGTYGPYEGPQSPSAGTPLMHAGCAATLDDRFGRCATPEHGNTGSLTPAQIADLVSYLETL